MGVAVAEQRRVSQRSGDRCAFEGCRRLLTVVEPATGEVIVLGEIAHIVAERRDGPRGLAAIEEGETAIVCTNTRSQTEIWYQAILAERPEWAGTIALHHGSLDAKRREWVEAGLRSARLRCVVATSSLDLGVDYSITQSCYDPDVDGRACGDCDACALRLRGFAAVGIRDLAPYQPGVAAAR